MSTFQQPPTRTLATRQELIDFINDADAWYGNYHASRVKADWLCAIIKRQVQAGHGMYIHLTMFNITDPNRTDRIAPADLTHPNAIVALEHLIFINNDYVRDDLLRAAGYEPLTAELICTAAAQHKQIEIAGKHYLPALKDDRWYVRAPRSRKYMIWPDNDTPARIARETQ